MARLEIPSIVVYKGSRSQDRPESPTVVVRGGMPSLPSSRQGLAVSGSGGGAPHQDASESDMIDGNANPNAGTSPAPNTLHRPAPSCPPPDKSDTESKNFRNRTNTKLKLLVRSHAMRESTSPPREPHGNGPPSPHSPQSADAEKKIACSLSPNSTGTKLNNNESMFNSNLCPAQSPKQMRNTATSPTCRTPSRNGQSSPSQVHSPKNITSPTNGNKLENHRSKFAGANTIQKCNNCVKNNQSERPGLLQTPVSPSKSGQALQHSPKSTNLALNAQNNQHKSEQRRPNTLNIHNQCLGHCGTMLSVSRPSSRHKLRHQNSSQGSYDSASPCTLSRDSSTEMYTDSTGIDLEQFIAETINRNHKDRTVLLKIEKDLIEFAKDRQKVSHRFPTMSSYNRMLVHRVAAYFGMEHNVDQSGQSVIVTRTKNMRIPDMRFKEHIRDDLILSEEPRRSILKRDSSSFEDSFNFKSPDRLSGDYCRRSKSFEEREEEYERARRRIFKDNSGEGSEVLSWPWSSIESSDTSGRNRLLHSTDTTHLMRQRFLKGESFDGRDSFRGTMLRPSVSKSFSFGGYTKGMLSRGDSVTSTHSAGARLMKQDSGASVCSRLSPSSSGYKSQSQRSDATISPSPSPSPVPAAMTCNHTQVSSQDSLESNGGQTVIWAVTSLSSVPPGSIIINPQTNQPCTNADGSIYRYDPDNPPKFFTLENENGNISATNKQQQQQHAELPSEPSRVTNGNFKNEGKKQRSSQSKINTGITSNGGAQVTNSATSPSLPFTPPPPPPPPPPPLPPSIPQQQMQQQQQQQQPIPQQQSLVKSSTMIQTCSHPNQTAQQPYATYVPTSESYNQAVYPPPVGQPTVMMASHPSQGQTGSQGDVVFNQYHQLYANYSMPVHQGPIPQSTDVADLSGYFLGMNIYDQRGNGDSHPTPPHSAYSQLPPSANQTVQNVQTVPPNYWQPPPNQIPPQQTMYFVPPPATALSVGQNPSDRQQLHQQQRFPTNYSFNAQTMTPPSQTNSNYVGSYPLAYNSVPTVTTTPGDYTYQPPVHMAPTYYPTPGQPTMQPPPVMYRVPTPPNTPTSNQMPGMPPLMYVNSNNYAPPAMMSSGTFGQVAHNAASSAPTSAYMAPTLVPNFVFRPNVSVVPGVRAATPANSQRASRSPTPAHEFFGGGSGDRSAQSQPRYPLPMYQGVHIVQGDMRLMHPGIPTNPRLQYAPVSSPPVVQGCPRSYRPPSNTSGTGTPTSFDGKNQKIRKQRSKVTSLPPNGTRPNLYQTPSIPSLPTNVPKDIREGTVKVTINRRNQVV